MKKLLTLLATGLFLFASCDPGTNLPGPPPVPDSDKPASDTPVTKPDPDPDPVPVTPQEKLMSLAELKDSAWFSGVISLRK